MKNKGKIDSKMKIYKIFLYICHRKHIKPETKRKTIVVLPVESDGCVATKQSIE